MGKKVHITLAYFGNLQTKMSTTLKMTAYEHLFYRLNILIMKNNKSKNKADLNVTYTVIWFMWVKTAIECLEIDTFYTQLHTFIQSTEL